MEERILVCLSSSPSNGKIIRTAAQMAEAFNGTLTALFVETPLAGKMGKEDQERLKGNIKLAKQSGAEIETVYGDDISDRGVCQTFRDHQDRDRAQRCKEKRGFCRNISCGKADRSCA